MVVVVVIVGLFLLNPPLGLNPGGRRPLRSSSNCTESMKEPGGLLTPPIFLGVGVGDGVVADAEAAVVRRFIGENFLMTTGGGEAV